MKIIIQAHKLQSLLNTAKEIVAKNPDPNNALGHHVLLNLFPEENKIISLAGDKEINHYTNIDLEPNLGESIELSSKLKFISLVASRLQDLLTGVDKDKLITILANDLSEENNELSRASILFDNIEAVVECSNGRGYTVLKDKDDEYHTVRLKIKEKTLKELIDSSINAANNKTGQGNNLIKAGLMFVLSEKGIKALGFQNKRIYLSEYTFGPNPFEHENEDKSRPLIGEGKNIVFAAPVKGASELSRLCDMSEEIISLEIHITVTGMIRLIEFKKGVFSIVFLVTRESLPPLDRIFPPSQIKNAVVSATELKNHIGRASKFDEAVTLSFKDDNTLLLSAEVANRFDSFTARIPCEIETSFTTRLNCKYLNEIINTFHTYADPDNKDINIILGMNNSARAPMVLIEELNKTDVSRRYALLAYSTIQNL